MRSQKIKIFYILLIIIISTFSFSYASYYNLGGFWKGANSSPGYWTWISGDNTWDLKQNGIKGTKGVSASTNAPGGRTHAAKWSDSLGNIWIYGGRGFDSALSYGELDDLWKFDITTKEWTWMSGDSIVGTNPVQGIKGVGDTANSPGSRIGSSAWLDSSGNFLWLFSGWINAGDPYSDLWKYEISTKKWTWVSGVTGTYGDADLYGTKGVGSTSNNPYGRSDAATAVDSSGNLILFGGYNWTGTGLAYYNDLWKFNPSNSEWTWIGGGTGTTNSTRNIIGIYGTKGVEAINNWPGSRTTRGWGDTSGNFWIFGGYGLNDATPAIDIETEQGLSDLWKFNFATGKWSYVSGTKTHNDLPTYGTKGIGSTSNFLGTRNFYSVWRDSSNIFWFFGGAKQYNFFWGADIPFADMWKYDPSNDNWSWVSGPSYDVDDHLGHNGTINVGSINNFPSSRFNNIFTSDNSGNFYIFSGDGVDSTGSSGIIDTMKFNSNNLEWTWIKGSIAKPVYDGVYSTGKGVPSTLNQPGIRQSAGLFTDASNNLFLFGGRYPYTYNSSVENGFNILWKFNPTSLEWTWLTGDQGICGTANYGTKGVAASSNTPPSLSGFASSTDSNGDIWIFGGHGKNCQWTIGVQQLWKYSPSTNLWTFVWGNADQSYPVGVYGTKGVPSGTNNPGSRYGAKMVADSSNNLWLFGGRSWDGAWNEIDMNDLWKYNTTTGLWTWISGDDYTSTRNGIYGTKGVANSSNNPGGRMPAGMWIDASNNIFVFGGEGRDSVNASNDNLNDLFKFDGTNWTWINGSNTSAGSGNDPVYNTSKVFSPTTTPGGRSYLTSSFQKGTSLFWFHGGTGKMPAGNWSLPELWAYDPGSNQWACWNNCNVSVNINYGTKGVSNATNNPADRMGASVTMDSNLNIWLFGGFSQTHYQTGGENGDLWRYK